MLKLAHIYFIIRFRYTNIAMILNKRHESWYVSKLSNKKNCWVKDIE